MSAATMIAEESIDFLVPVPRSQLVRLLLIENEPEVARTLKGRFESVGCTVDIAEFPDQARTFLDTEVYQIIVTDQGFGVMGPNGDQFILENENLMGKARKIVITGNALEAIGRQAELKEKGIPIFEKGEVDFLEKLKAVIREAFNERKEAVSSRLREMVSLAFQEKAISSGPLPKSEVINEDDTGLRLLLEKLQEMVISAFKRDGEDGDRQGIFYAGQELSPNELIDQIRRGTLVGRAHVDMFLNLVKHALEI